MLDYDGTLWEHVTTLPAAHGHMVAGSISSVESVVAAVGAPK